MVGLPLSFICTPVDPEYVELAEAWTIEEQGHDVLITNRAVCVRMDETALDALLAGLNRLPGAEWEFDTSFGRTRATLDVEFPLEITALDGSLRMDFGVGGVEQLRVLTRERRNERVRLAGLGRAQDLGALVLGARRRSP